MLFVSWGQLAGPHADQEGLCGVQGFLQGFLPQGFQFSNGGIRGNDAGHQESPEDEEVAWVLERAFCFFWREGGCYCIVQPGRIEDFLPVLEDPCFSGGGQWRRHPL